MGVGNGWIRCSSNNIRLWQWVTLRAVNPRAVNPAVIVLMLSAASLAFQVCFLTEYLFPHAAAKVLSECFHVLLPASVMPGSCHDMMTSWKEKNVVWSLTFYHFWTKSMRSLWSSHYTKAERWCFSVSFGCGRVFCLTSLCCHPSFQFDPEAQNETGASEFVFSLTSRPLLWQTPVWSYSSFSAGTRSLDRV